MEQGKFCRVPTTHPTQKLSESPMAGKANTSKRGGGISISGIPLASQKNDKHWLPVSSFTVALAYDVIGYI